MSLTTPLLEGQSNHSLQLGTQVSYPKGQSDHLRQLRMPDVITDLIGSYAVENNAEIISRCREQGSSVREVVIISGKWSILSNKWQLLALVALVALAVSLPIILPLFFIFVPLILLMPIIVLIKYIKENKDSIQVENPDYSPEYVTALKAVGQYDAEYDAEYGHKTYW